MRVVPHGISFSPIERADLLKAWIATSLAFAIFFLRGGFLDSSGMSLPSFVVVFLIAAVTAGLGFILHELCHKFAAHYFRIHGEFRSNDLMLILSIVLAIAGFLFAAPGAVYMTGTISRKESGVTSAAGPAANIALALLFLPFALALPATTVLGIIGRFGLLINAILGAFNLIPMLGFDGEKVLRWHKGVFFALLFLAGILVISGYVLLGVF